MIRIKMEKISDKIHLLIFDNQFEITSTMIRFQEHYESPYFKDKIFSLEEFKSWYIENSPNGKKTGEFTYYSDWNGFNIPSQVLKPFYEGLFEDISENEQLILKKFKNERDNFYIIGVHGAFEKPEELLRHEIAHALFSTDKNYKREVLSAISQHDVQELKKEIKQLGGYHDDVLEDEVHAYIIDSTRDFKAKINNELSKKLRVIYEKYLK